MDGQVLVHKLLLIPALCYEATVLRGDYRIIIHWDENSQNNRLRQTTQESVADIIDRYLQISDSRQQDEQKYTTLPLNLYDEEFRPIFNFPCALKLTERLPKSSV